MLWALPRASWIAFLVLMLVWIVHTQHGFAFAKTMMGSQGFLSYHYVFMTVAWCALFPFFRLCRAALCVSAACMLSLFGTDAWFRTLPLEKTPNLTLNYSSRSSAGSVSKPDRGSFAMFAGQSACLRPSSPTERPSISYRTASSWSLLLTYTTVVLPHIIQAADVCHRHIWLIGLYGTRHLCAS